ncbi:MAG: glycosyltransferase [Ferruginibacter sp.]|nr:glycosyltransferase [Cytophagales bacterium]
MQSKSILFANFPADGHFNPLTSLAIHLKNQGHDVRWYTSVTYEEKIKELGIPFYPLKRAFDVSAGDPEEIFPERKKHKSQVSKLKFDLKHSFILRSKEYYEDIKEISADFPFDLVITDIAFTGLLFIKEKLGKPVIAVGVIPLSERSKDLPPAGLGLTPSSSFWGRRKQDVFRFVSDALIFRESNALIKSICQANGLKVEKGNVFDTMYRKSNLVLQNGTPKFEYQRSDLSTNIRFIGPLLPYSPGSKPAFQHFAKVNQYSKVILVTQGTVEKDPEKIIVPTLEAFKGTDYLVIATTGGSQTEALRKRYPQPNLVIEDFIPFDTVMPFCQVYITNGGYGGVLLSIKNKLPLVVAGIHEGKNDINARVGYFKLGINLKTEKPTPAQIRDSVAEILSNPAYKTTISQLNEEFSAYNPQLLCEKYVNEVLDIQAAVNSKEMAT